MRTLLSLVTLTCLAGAAGAQGQLQLPLASPAASTSAVVSTTTITIEYHRPGVKGRAIWGGLVPYGEVWRAGANEATTIKFSDAVKIDGKDVPAGTYTLFAIPAKDKWTIVLNKNEKQWGAYSYDSKLDLLRFDVKSEAAPDTEWLTYVIMPLGPNSASVQLMWEKLKVAFTVDVDPTQVQKMIQDAVAKAKPGDWSTYFQAASYYFENNMKSEQAMEWVDQSIKAKETWRNLSLKSQILAKAGKKSDAAACLEKSVALAKQAKGLPKEVVDELEQELGKLKSKS